MKWLSIILVLLLFAGCDVISGDKNKFVVTPIENPEQSHWDFANFRYMVEKNDGAGSLEETKDLLSSLLRKGITVEKAWYRQGTSSCGALQVVVPTQLLLVIDSIPDPHEITDQLEPIDSTPDFFCPNNVMEIKPS